LERLNELLDKKGLELEAKIADANEWARRYQELLTTAGDDPQLQDLIREGELEQAGVILDQRIEEQEAVIERLAENHFQRRSSACSSSRSRQFHTTRKRMSTGRRTPITPLRMR
jgi:hypothetical protein